MAGLNRIDASAIHAVVVGLECYPRAPHDWSLRGAGEDAVRFARWLRRGGVPKENIRLLLSPLEESQPAIDAAVEEADVACRFVATVDDIMGVFISELKDATGRLLYLYWGGHGVLGEDGRLLFHPNASEDNKLCLSVEQLRSFLTRTALRGFDQQVFLFDVCATFVEDYRAESGPVVVPFPRTDREMAEQFLLHASRDGQVAEHDSAAGSGMFSQMVLDWLEQHAPDLHPDLSVLQDDVRQHFEQRSAAGGPEQMPVTCRYLSLDGAQDDTVTYMAPVDPVARLEVVGTLESVLRDEGTRKVYAARVARACGAVRLAAGYSVECFAEVLLGAPRAMATLIDELFSCEDSDKLSRGAGLDAARRFLAIALASAPPGLLSAGEHADLRMLLTDTPELSPALVNGITQHVLPGGIGVQVETGSPVTAIQLMAHIENLEQHQGGYSHASQKGLVAPAVIRFAQYLAASACDRDPGWCWKLAAWNKRVTERLGVGADTLEKLRDDAESWAQALMGAGSAPRVVVQVYPNHPAKTFTCVVWADPGTGELARYTHPDNGVPLDSVQAVQLIERAIRSLSVSDAAAPVVEIVLEPESVLDVPVYTWDGAGADDLVPLLLAVRRRIALRCAPLASIEREEDRRARLERRWNRRNDGKVVYLDEWHIQDRRAYGALEEDQEAARVVVRAGRGDSAGMIQTALFLGYPVIIWDHEAASAVTDAHFVPLGPEETFPELPERVRSYWAKVCGDSSRHPVRPALLLEEHDRELPPVLPMTRQSVSDEVSM